MPKDKINDVVTVEFRDSGFVRWYHIWLVRLLIIGSAVGMFMWTIDYSEYLDLLESPSAWQTRLSTISWIVSGIFFLYLIQTLFEIVHDFPGINPWLTRKLLARNRSYVSVRRRTIEYQLHTRRRNLENLELEVVKMCKQDNSDITRQ